MPSSLPALYRPPLPVRDGAGARAPSAALRGPVLEAAEALAARRARKAYLERQYSGDDDRRPPAGLLRRERL